MPIFLSLLTFLGARFLSLGPVGVHETTKQAQKQDIRHAVYSYSGPRWSGPVSTNSRSPKGALLLTDPGATSGRADMQHDGLVYLLCPYSGDTVPYITRALAM